MVTPRLRGFAVFYLAAQSLGAAAWWVALGALPELRAQFMPSWAREEALWAFVLPDLLLFIGAAMLAAYGIRAGRAWAWPVLVLHAGAAMYAGLVTVMLAALTGEGWLGAYLMVLPIFVPIYLAWRLRP